MPAITRRTLLALTGAAIAVDPVSADVRTSPQLQALIAAHEAAYAAFHRVVHRPGSRRDDRERADSRAGGAAGNLLLSGDQPRRPPGQGRVPVGR